MAHEIDAAQASALGDLFRLRRKAAHAAPPGTPCANCATPLQGPWCHACGQLGEDFHRSWIHLVGESVEGLIHFDGRFWRTLPDLILRPARLTRLYLEGHRAPQIPPLRLFLVVLLVMFLAGSVGVKDTRGPAVRTQNVAGAQAMEINVGRGKLTDEQKAKIKASLGQIKVQFGSKPDPEGSAWLRERIGRVLDNPLAFQLILESWSERFAFLMLPISALLMSLLFVFQRRFYLFDHLVFTMHSLSFLGLLIGAVILLTTVLGGWAQWLWFAPPVHLFAHMRGVYRTSVIGTLIRMLLLFVGSVAGFSILMLGLVFVGLAAVGE
jgi:hypothetical protein